ncbi:MAG: twin-arginine translocase subunit TatB [Thiotrichales bacterium]|nr:twin-arginine translocase subunit TatB [Thiotrichales bacterium]
MFDIGFLEILIVLIIALLVIGPQRMPEVARKLGAFMGKTKRFIESVKQEGHLQETVDELKKSMDMQEEKKSIQNLENDLFESLNQPTQEIDMETFKRPTFGGAEPVSTSGGSQFSKAPSQPKMPEPETPTVPSAATSPAKSDETSVAAETQTADKPSASSESTNSSKTETKVNS